MFVGFTVVHYVFYCPVLSWLCGNEHQQLQRHKDNWWRSGFVSCII